MIYNPIYACILIILSWVPVMLYMLRLKYFGFYLGISMTFAISALAYALFGFITLT